LSALLNQAISLHQLGKLDEAEKLYRDLLGQEPKQADALALLGLVRAAKGDGGEALALIDRAIDADPKSPLFQLHRGNVLAGLKNFPEAATAFRRAAELQPSWADAHYNLANALRGAGDWTGAIASYENAIRAKPNYPEAFNNLALALVHEKKYEEALAASKKSVQLAPKYGDGWLTLCNIAEQVKDYPLAVEAGKKNVEFLPDNHRAWFGYGVALNRVDRNEEAVTAYKRALELKPDRADIWDNLGQTYQSMNRLDEAEAAFRKTIEVAGQAIPGEGAREVAEEEYGNRHWHLALLELLMGKYKEGFARYRSRFRDVGGLSRQKFSRPVWKGEDIAGKTVLVTDEQGFGDTLMLARYLPLMKKRGAKIVFSLHPVLRPLFEGWPAIDRIIVHGDTIQSTEYDFHASVFDLPHIFGTTLETIPTDIPYLPILPPSEETRLEGDGRPKIGVVWGGSPLHANDTRRSVPLKIFGELFFDKKFQFFSLNRDKKAGDIEELPKYPVTDLAPRIKTFADGARFTQQMDLIITVDTATAHLAGGMGKKTWVLLPFAPDWRWLVGRSDSVWYPATYRLFRQPKISDWQGAVDQVKEALEKL